MRAEGLDGKVIFTGRQDNMKEVLSALDVLVTMSGGSVMFEAMAAGACVLSIRADGRHSLHTLHDQTAWCVTTDQAAPATEALWQLLQDSQLRSRLAAAARQRVQEQLSLNIMSGKVSELYERLIGK